MIKLVFCLRRQPSLSREAFQDYWFNHHARMGQKLMMKMGTLRYVQTHTLDSELNRSFKEDRGSPEPYDGVAEAWWPSMDHLRSILADEVAREAFKSAVQDERNFIDFTNSPIWLATEKVIIDGGALQQDVWDKPIHHME